MSELPVWRDSWWLMALWALAHLVYVGRVNPEVLVHRSSLKKGTETWDRVVRHPGYVGMIAWILSMPLLLTSSWAFIPAGLTVLSLVVRTALEDRTLHTKLEGYADYAARVRSRLVPGVW